MGKYGSLEEGHSYAEKGLLPSPHTYSHVQLNPAVVAGWAKAQGSAQGSVPNYGLLFR